MPIKDKTKVTLIRVAAILYAIAGVIALLAAIEDHKRTHIAQSVLWFSLCVIFLSTGRIARNRRKARQSQEGDASNKSQ